MPTSPKQFALRVITGQVQSLPASATRAALGIAEPFYAAAMRIRNTCYNRGLFHTHDLGRPTISVGNITTGGTGKTPVVQWLADELRRRGRRPAILLRGYASSSSQQSDEAQLLDQALNTDQQAKIPVQPNPSRVQGAAEVLRDHPEVTHFILDDGFQHRKAWRDFNLVLVSATEPFGYGHVLPRGLLREPLPGLGRADAFVITRCSLVSKEDLSQIDSFLARRHPQIPVFHCDHVQSSIWFPATGEKRTIDSLRGRRVFLAAGIGDPAAFQQQILSSGAEIAGVRWFADHHAFTTANMKSMLTSATNGRSDLLLTTRKDWVKMKTHAQGTTKLPMAIVNLEIRFWENDAERLLAMSLSRPAGVALRI